DVDAGGDVDGVRAGDLLLARLLGVLQPAPRVDAQRAEARRGVLLLRGLLGGRQVAVLEGLEQRVGDRVGLVLEADVALVAGRDAAGVEALPAGAEAEREVEARHLPL